MTRTNKLSRRAKNELDELIHEYTNKDLTDSRIRNKFFDDSDAIQTKFDRVAHNLRKRDGKSKKQKLNEG